MSELVQDKKVVDLIAASVERVNSGLARFETIKKFSILDNEFTLEGGELTPTLKVKRKVVYGKHKNVLDSFYEE
jgi:long-chain acyl-CoA synthetase